MKITNRKINTDRKKYCIVEKETGKIMEYFRLKSTAIHFLTKICNGIPTNYEVKETKYVTTNKK